MIIHDMNWYSIRKMSLLTSIANDQMMVLDFKKVIKRRKFKIKFSIRLDVCQLCGKRLQLFKMIHCVDEVKF